MITTRTLLAVMPNCAPVAVAWVGALEQALAAFHILTGPRVAMFLAQIAHESRELLELEENMHYSAARLRQIFPRYFPDDELAHRYAALGPEAIASRVYANRLGNGPEESGDGWIYRGRGPIGVTFKANYIAASIAVCGDADTLLKNPEFVALPDFGAAAAGNYWESRGCNQLADADDFDGVCDVVNLGRKTLAAGDSIGFTDRLSYYKRALAAQPA